MRVWRTTISLLQFGTYTIVILQFLQGIVLTSPVIKRSSRMVREVYPEIETEKREGNQAEVCIVGDVVYGAEEPVPSDQPCLKCKCQPPGVQCEAIQCSQKQGCKAIHKSNQCCPEYQCECVHNGKVYGNGERLATPPGGECSVCYCRGGEVQCANVSCYKRADCEGRTVPGQCCPKYDHCPLKEPFIERQVPQVTTTTANVLIEQGGYTTAIYDVGELFKHDNKITDSQSGATIGPVSVQSNRRNYTVFDNRSTESILVIDINIQSKEVVSQNAPKITIQEIIPDVREIAITAAPQQNINMLAQNGYSPSAENQSLDSDKEITSDLTIGDTDSEPSEISETYHHPPPVLKIGDQLLIFKKGELVSEKDISTPVPVITIIGAEGLQRGTEDSSEFHEISSQLQGPQKDIDNFDDIFENENETKSYIQSPPQKETNIISFVKQKKLTSTTTTETIIDRDPILSEFEELDSNTTLNEDVFNQTKFSNNFEEIGADLVSQNTTTHVINETSEINLPQNQNIQTTTPLRSKSIILETTTEFHLLIDKPSVINKNAVSQPVNNTNITDSIDSLANETLIGSYNYLTNITNVTHNESSSDTVENVSSHFTPHILINPKAALSPSILDQVAESDIHNDSDTELEDIQTPASSAITNLQAYEITEKPIVAERAKDISKESLEDSSEASTNSTQTFEQVSTENASIETTPLNTTDLVEILPGFQITTEKVTSIEEQSQNETEIITGQDLLTTVKPVVELNKNLDSATDEDIFKQLNEELNGTFSSLNFTAFKSNESEAEAIFKELLEEVTSSTLPPHTKTQNSSFVQLHEKESQLLQKVSEAISKFQSKESKEALDTRIMAILKDYFDSQHKLDTNKSGTDTVLATNV